MRLNRLLVVIVSIGLLAAAVVGSNYLRSTLKNSLPVLETLGGDFSLPSTEGKTTTLSDFEGKVVLLNFGFTSCPDVCPTVLTKIRALMETLGEQSSGVQPLFVTIDPDRDSIEKLSSYLPYFHSSIIGLRGDKTQLAKVADLYKVLHQKEYLDSALEYGFLHNDHIYLIDQQGRVRAMYSGSVKLATIIEQIKTLL
ncbi:MAG: photosynthetic protein synthase I [Porticoccaceae bacterium]|nr:MAG: photosynthetic protein synthase I [Porticoccaceae bacterium]